MRRRVSMTYEAIPALFIKQSELFYCFSAKHDCNTSTGQGLSTSIFSTGGTVARTCSTNVVTPKNVPPASEYLFAPFFLLRVTFVGHSTWMFKKS